VLFFLKNAGELRFIILRRKSGQEPVTTVHKLTALYGLYSRLWQKGATTQRKLIVTTLST
jgi:hypothetical protein